jgi:hypothetical protein
LYSFPCITTKALDRRIIHLASTVSSGSVFFIMCAKYGYIQVSLIIITSSGSDVLPWLILPAPEPVAWCCPRPSVVEVLLFFIDLSMISSQKTPFGIGKWWRPVGEGDYSSLVPGNGARKLAGGPCA